MNAILSIIAAVFGKFLFLIYNTVGMHNYALALFLFTIAVKLLLLPLSIKQIHSSQKMQEIQPELQKIQERYKNDKQKLNEETMKLYQEKKYNPASGCLPLLIQMPILFALFFVIRMPMTYMLSVPANTLGDLAVKAIAAQADGFDASDVDKIVKAVKIESIDEIMDDPREMYTAISKADYYYEIKIVDFIMKNPDVIDGAILIDDAKKDVLRKFDITLFKIFNFGVQPTYDLKLMTAEPLKYIPALILLIIAVVTTYISSKIMMPKPTGDQPKGAGCTTNSMLYMGPAMTLMFGFSMPCGLAFYWIISNVISVGQSYYLNHLKEKAKEKGEIARAQNGKKGS